MSKFVALFLLHFCVAQVLFLYFCIAFPVQMFCLHNYPILGPMYLIDRKICLLICWLICLAGFDRLFGSFYYHINFLSFANLLPFFVVATGSLWPLKWSWYGTIILINVTLRLQVCWGMCLVCFACLFGCICAFINFL